MHRRVRLVWGMVVMMFLSNALSLYLGYTAGKNTHLSAISQSTHD